MPAKKTGGQFWESLLEKAAKETPISVPFRLEKYRRVSFPYVLVKLNKLSGVS